MKTRISIRNILAFICECSFIALAGCSEGDPVTPEQGEKIVAIKLFQDEVPGRTETFLYSGELLTEWVKVYTNPSQEVKVKYYYNGQQISSFEYYIKENDAWTSVVQGEITGYSGDHPLEIREHFYDSNGVEELQLKTVFTYAGNLLKRKTGTMAYFGTWGPARITDYLYDSQGRIKQETDTGQYYDGYIRTFRYDEARMTESTEVQFPFGNIGDSSITLYFYSGDQLSGYSRSAQWYGVWGTMEETTFEYDAYGNLARELSLNQSRRIEYSYSSGKGNYRQCMQSTGAVILPGDPVPYPVKSTMKNKPGCHEKAK